MRNRKSNFETHIKGIKHSTKEQNGELRGLRTIKEKEDKKIFICTGCDSKFSYISGLSRHKKTCKAPEPIKEKNEDFMTILSGALGQKKRIHIHVGKVLDAELDGIVAENDNSNKQIQALAQVIDDSILSNYNLWPTNFIAYDIVNNTDAHAHLYTENEKSLFQRRLEMRIDQENPIALEGFLAMYANPVVNKSKYHNVI